jgi:hypothetical protein
LKINLLETVHTEWNTGIQWNTGTVLYTVYKGSEKDKAVKATCYLLLAVHTEWIQALCRVRKG